MRRGADPIAWLLDRQGLSFREAVEELARRYAIPLPEQDPEAAARAEVDRQERQRLRQWRSQQEEQFHQALLSDLQVLGPAALYLQQRGINPETAMAWRLGLNASRLMLPIHDGQGLLVEGPLDVIRLHQAGFSNAVAAMGTVLTLEQLQLLRRRGARRLLVLFDGDGAGTRATGKLIAGLRSAVISSGLELAVVALPTGTDPDGLIRSQGPDALQLGDVFNALDGCPEAAAALAQPHLKLAALCGGAGPDAIALVCLHKQLGGQALEANDTTVGWYRSEPGRNSTRSAEQIAREQHAVRVALCSDGSEIQQVDNLHRRGNRNLCY